MPPKKGKKITDFTNKELESFIREAIATAVKARVGTAIDEKVEEIKNAVGQNALNIQTVQGQVEVAKEIIDKVYHDFDEALKAMADIRQMEALQSMARSLEGIFKVKKDYADKMAAQSQVIKEEIQAGQEPPQSPFKHVPTPPVVPPVEKIIGQIRQRFPQLTVEAIERLIDDERAKAAGLLTEEAAAHLVASNLGLGEKTAETSTPNFAAINWREGRPNQRGETSRYVYSNDFPELFTYLQANNGREMWGDYDIVVGRNTKYINLYKADTTSPASEAQVNKLREWGVSFPIGLTKRDASKLMSAKIAEFKAKKR